VKVKMYAIHRWQQRFIQGVIDFFEREGGVHIKTIKNRYVQYEFCGLTYYIPRNQRFAFSLLCDGDDPIVCETGYYFKALKKVRRRLLKRKEIYLERNIKNTTSV